MLSSRLVKEKAKALGFSACGIAPVEEAKSEADYLAQWLAAGCHAGMTYMENRRAIRLNPAQLLEDAKSVISVALNYYPKQKLPADVPHIAYYAYGRDYHDVMKGMLRQLWWELMAAESKNLPVEPEKMGQEPPAVRFCTDSAPILERYWAWRAGLGWIGKNTNLIIPGKGSFFFLGEIVTTWEADAYDVPQKNRCGTCTRCLDACPTGALETPRHLNAAKCLSYLTIEHRGEIPEAQAACLGNRLFGCDTCQEVCPWNRFATPTEVEALQPSEAFSVLTRTAVETLSEADYRRIFAHSAVKRAKYSGLLRTLSVWKKQKGCR